VAALRHPSAGARRAAVAVLPRGAAFANAILSAGLLKDADASTRLASLLALSDEPSSDPAGEAVFAMLRETRNSLDPWIPDAATAAAARSDAGFIRAVLRGGKMESAAKQPSMVNRISNASFENERDGAPQGWRRVTYSGQAEFGIGELGHTGSRSVRVSSQQGADASWSTTVAVEPHQEYKLSAWVKTENLRRVNGAGLGALLNIHELQDAEKGATKPLTGDNDWTRLELSFNSGDMSEVTVNCLFGGWGHARGVAWFDDVELVPGGVSGLSGPVGRVVQLVTASYAQRAPVDSIVATLSALKGAPESTAAPILDGLVSGWPKESPPTFSDQDIQALTNVMAGLPETAKDRLLALAQRWGQANIFGADVAAIVAGLKLKVADATLPDDQRIASARRWVGFNDQPEVVGDLLAQVGLLTPPGLASGFVSALGESRNPGTAKAITAAWPKFTPSVKRTAVSTLARRVEWCMALLDAVQKNTVPKTDLSTEQWSQLKQNPNQNVARRAESLSAAVGAVSADRAEIVKKLLPLAKEKGDAARGKEVFTANCAVCHTFNGQGGKIGPELTGIGARNRSEILIDILDPNRSVEANYRMWNVTTKDGDTYSGRLETETQTSVEILDTTGQKHVIQRKEIGALDGTMLSIMPNGFESLPPQDLKSLLEYITQTRPQ
jgi:putative heme-binding domain-containing protein